jgi:apolipoprotein N-acyltransferase
MDWRHNFFIRVLVSGFFLGIGFFLPWLWWISFAGLLPLLKDEIFISHRPLILFWYGWLLGIVLYGIALWGFSWDTLPLTWYGIDSPLVQFLGVGANWLLTAGSLAVGTGVFVSVIRYVWRNKVSDLLVVPLAWVICEQIGSYTFDLVFLGPGSLVGGHFTLGHLGYLLSNDTVLLQLASVGGIYLLSFFVIFVNLAFYRLIITKPKQFSVVSICTIALIIYIGVYAAINFVPHTQGQPIEILALSRYIPAKFHTTPEVGRARAEATLSLLSGHQADILLLPEGAALTKYLTPQELAQLQSQFKVIVDEQNVHEGVEVSFSRALFLYQDGTTAIHEKELPLPVGEYMPYLHRLVLNFLPEAFRRQVLSIRSVTSGSDQNFVGLGSAQVSVRFCNEVMSPSLYADDVATGATLLANISSHGWFHGSRFVYENMRSAAKVRAVESGRWYVQASNMVPAFAIDSYGRVIGESAWGNPAALTIQVESRSSMTIYGRIIHMLGLRP